MDSSEAANSVLRSLQEEISTESDHDFSQSESEESGNSIIFTLEMGVRVE